MPIEAHILKKVQDSPMTVSDLMGQVSCSETLVRLAIKRLFLRGLIDNVGRKEGRRGRSPNLYQAYRKPGVNFEFYGSIHMHRMERSNIYTSDLVTGV
jgi:predicted transcriptional regulator